MSTGVLTLKFWEIVFSPYLNQKEVEFVSIFLYASPQSLQVGTYWYQCLVTLSSWDMFWLIVIDKAHSVAQGGHDFWPEFQSAVTTLKTLYDNHPSKCSWIAMSATLCKSDQNITTMIYGQAPNKIIWLKLSWQGIVCNVNISGNHSSLISNSVTQDYKHPTNLKTILYKNSKQQAQGTLLNSMQCRRPPILRTVQEYFWRAWQGQTWYVW